MTSAGDALEPRWRIRRTSMPWWRPWDRLLVQADLLAPDGVRYHVRVLRNLPFRGTPLGPFDNFVPQHVSLAVLIGANLYTRGRTGWRVQVVAAETAWRASRVVHTQKVRGAAEVADVALDLAGAVRRGEKPWADQERASLREGVRRLMNWSG